MSESKNIKNYSAADIEKYWHGGLSMAEMHAMEKAAMDDPLLADAIEGFKEQNDTNEAIGKLKKKLDERINSKTKAGELPVKKFYWLRIAASIVIIGGLGILASQLFTGKIIEPIVQEKEIRPADSPATIEDNLPENNFNQPDGSASAKNEENKNSEITKKGNQQISSNVKAEAKATTNDFNKNIEQEKVINEEAKSNTEVTALNQPTAKNIQENVINTDNKQLKSRKLDEISAPYEIPNPNRVDTKKENRAVFNNTYIYHIVDEQNNPIPFANIQNTQDNIGTYTDIQGRFNLISSDSILNVQVKSLGYNNTNYILTPSKQPGLLILKEDENARKDILANNTKVVSSVRRKDSTSLEEPEVGWGYYNTYVANNINISDIVKEKNTRNNVELSFDIDNYGNPINIKVTKSSNCKECDEEAIRLLKQGPKWKRKTKRSKARVSIHIDN